MTEPVSREHQAANLLSLADHLLVQLESIGEGVRGDHLLLQASFLTRLAAALLLEPDFPTLPDGLHRLLDRDRARALSRHLGPWRSLQTRSFSTRAGEPTPRFRRAGKPGAAIDHELAAETAATLDQLRASRLDLMAQYLSFADPQYTSQHPEAEGAALALVDAYWRDRRRLLSIVTERSPRPSRRGIPDQLHRPVWENEVTWDLWRSLDQRFLWWSDPPAPPNPGSRNCESLSQEL